MLHLTPLEKTVAGREVFTMGLKEGIKEGIEEGKRDGINKGELIGEICLAQRLLKRRVQSKEALVFESLETLQKMFQQLEVDLAPILS